MFVFRYLALLALTFWVGGFTFYSAIVIPELHQSLGSVETGAITQRVTDTLNAIGVVTLTGWWLWAAFERRVGTRCLRRGRIGPLIASTALLVVLIALHRVMDHRLESGSLRGFYPWHRAYLLASTAQWVANLGLLFVALRGAERDRDS